MKRAVKVLAILCVLALMFVLVAGCGQKKEEAPAGETKAPAKTYPTKTINMVLGFGAGGNSDTCARAMQPYLQKYLDTPIRVENRVGSGAALARNYVYEQPADGYTIFAGMNSDVMFSVLYKDSQSYKGDFLEEFIPVAAWINGDGNALFVKKGSEIKDLDTLIKMSKEKTLNLAMAGSFGSSDHATALIMEKMWGVKWNLIPYNSAAETVAAIRGGQGVDFGLVGITADAVDPAVLDFLGITASDRVAKLPDTKTFKEMGYPELDIPWRFGAFVKKGTPEDIVNTIAEAIGKAFNDENFQKWAADTKKPIGKFYDRKMWTDHMNEYNKRVQDILPDMIKSMAEAQGAAKK